MALLEINRDPDPKQLRWFTALWFPASFFIIGFLLYGRSADLLPAAIFWRIAVVVPPLGLAFFRLMGLVWIVWMTLVFPIGFVVSHVILLAIWWLVVTPIGLLMRLAGKDPMNRRFDRAAATYWEPYSPHGNKKRYFRQF